jgi:hypothetical protein
MKKPGREGSRPGLSVDDSESLLLQLIANDCQQIGFVRELACQELRVNQFIVDAKFKAPTRCGNQLHRSDFGFVSRQKAARQTEGLWLVASRGAVL